MLEKDDQATIRKPNLSFLATEMFIVVEITFETIVNEMFNSNEGNYPNFQKYSWL